LRRFTKNSTLGKETKEIGDKIKFITSLLIL
jgi:hypothetical protein